METGPRAVPPGQGYAPHSTPWDEMPKDVDWRALLRADPLQVVLPDTSFPDANWQTVLPLTTYSLPDRPGNSILIVNLSLHISWSANSGTMGLCDWSIDAHSHFRRTFHAIINKQDDSTVNGVDLTFSKLVSGTSPTVSVQGRQISGPTLITILGTNNSTWPSMGSQAIILDGGPVTY